MLRTLLLCPHQTYIIFSAAFIVDYYDCIIHLLSSHTSQANILAYVTIRPFVTWTFIVLSTKGHSTHSCFRFMNGGGSSLNLLGCRLSGCSLFRRESQSMRYLRKQGFIIRNVLLYGPYNKANPLVALICIEAKSGYLIP